MGTLYRYEQSDGLHGAFLLYEKSGIVFGGGVQETVGIYMKTSLMETVLAACCKFPLVA